MVITRKTGDALTEGKELPLSEMRERAKRAAYASIQKASQAPRTTGVAGKMISDYISVLEGMKKAKTDGLIGIQESMAGETTGRRLILYETCRRVERTIGLLDEEIGLLQKASEIVEKMEHRLLAAIDGERNGTNLSERVLFGAESVRIGAKLIQLTKWLDQMGATTNKEGKDIAIEISYLKAYLGIKTAGM